MIYVLGSINYDMSLELERIPKKGETLSADGLTVGLGGKGANQAVAIARLGTRSDKGGSPVSLIGHVGKDSIGAELIKRLGELNVNSEFVRQVNRPTGTAVVTVTGKDNRIMVYAGANATISKTDVDEALEHATGADTLLCQLEVPLYVVAYAMRKARSIGMTTILNPAPAKELPDDLYYNSDIIIPNETEAQILTGINPRDFDSQCAAMDAFHERGVRYVVITLGDKGAVVSDGGKMVAHIPPYKVKAVDTTGAGDTFVGALALAYPHIGMYSFMEACGFATKAAAITVSRRGAAESIPTFDEVCALYSNVIKN